MGFYEPLYKCVQKYTLFFTLFLRFIVRYSLVNLWLLPISYIIHFFSFLYSVTSG